MTEAKRFDLNEYQRNPWPFRRFTKAKVTNVPERIYEFTPGEPVEIEYFGSFPNQSQGGTVMPAYKVKKVTEDFADSQPHLLFGDALGDFEV